MSRGVIPEALLLDVLERLSEVPVLWANLVRDLRDARWRGLGREQQEDLKHELRDLGAFFDTRPHGAGLAEYVATAAFETVMDGRGRVVPVGDAAWTKKREKDRAEQRALEQRREEKRAAREAGSVEIVARYARRGCGEPPRRAWMVPQDAVLDRAAEIAAKGKAKSIEVYVGAAGWRWNRPRAVVVAQAVQS